MMTDFYKYVSYCGRQLRRADRFPHLSSDKPESQVTHRLTQQNEMHNKVGNSSFL